MFNSAYFLQSTCSLKIFAYLIFVNILSIVWHLAPESAVGRKWEMRRKFRQQDNCKVPQSMLLPFIHLTMCNKPIPERHDISPACCAMQRDSLLFVKVRCLGEKQFITLLTHQLLSAEHIISVKLWRSQRHNISCVCCTASALLPPHLFFPLRHMTSITM